MTTEQVTLGPVSALKLYEEARRGGCPDAVANNLAAMYKQQGNVAEAIELCEEAHRGAGKVLSLVQPRAGAFALRLFCIILNAFVFIFYLYLIPRCFCTTFTLSCVCCLFR